MTEYTPFEERAAIMQYDGNMEKHEAEKLAYKDNIRQVTDKYKNKNIQLKLFEEEEK